MKRYICLGLSVIFAVALATGCNKNNDDDNVVQEPVTEQITEITTDTTTEVIQKADVVEKIIERNPEPLDYTAQEIIVAAEKEYAWFVTEPLSHDENQSITVDGIKYYKVTDENKNTAEKLSHILSGYFSSEVIENLLANGMYVTGDDGFLYTKAEGKKANDDIASVEYTTAEVGENECYLKAEVTYKSSGETKIYSYDYAKVDQKWVFIDFNYFK